MPWDKSKAPGLRPGRINIKTKMNTNEFLDKVLPRTTMSKDEMTKAVSDANEDSLFHDAEKCFRSMAQALLLC